MRFYDETKQIYAGHADDIRLSAGKFGWGDSSDTLSLCVLHGGIVSLRISDIDDLIAALREAQRLSQPESRRVLAD